MLAKNFNKIIRRLDRRFRNNVSYHFNDNHQSSSKVGKFQRRGNTMKSQTNEKESNAVNAKYFYTFKSNAQIS